MNQPVQWILASGSPRRRELLCQLNPEFLVIAPNVPEWEPEEADPVHQVEENALRKGKVVADAFPQAIVIAADTTVALGNRLFAKPQSRNEAVEMLRALSGRTHTVVTGIALFYNQEVHCFHETSQVSFNKLSDQDIDKYISSVHVFDKAGAYAIQENGEIIVDQYEGSYENIMGLPIQRLRQELVQLGWMPAPASAD